MVEAASTVGQPKQDGMRSHGSRTQMAIKLQNCNCMKGKGLSRKVCGSKTHNGKEKF